MPKKYKPVYYSGKKVWRTDKDMSDRYDFIYMGLLTQLEFELFIEILSELYNDQDISISDFAKLFDKFKNFCFQIKKIEGN